jgi:hypothetical protein
MTTTATTTAQATTISSLSSLATSNGWEIVSPIWWGSTLVLNRGGHVLTVHIARNGTLSGAAAQIPGFRNDVTLPSPRRQSVEMALTA